LAKNCSSERQDRRGSSEEYKSSGLFSGLKKKEKGEPKPGVTSAKGRKTSRKFLVRKRGKEPKTRLGRPQGKNSPERGKNSLGGGLPQKEKVLSLTDVTDEKSRPS